MLKKNHTSENLCACERRRHSDPEAINEGPRWKLIIGANINRKRVVTGTAFVKHKLHPSKKRFRLIVLAIPAVVLAVFLVAAASGSGVITRASTDSAGNQGNAGSQNASVSADGRYVAFDSNASNLVYGDTNGVSDVFVKDMRTGAISRASTDASGNQANSWGYNPSISADGNYVTFYSEASNLVAGDTNASSDIFIKNVQTGGIWLASTDASGNQANSNSENPSIPANSSYVGFDSTASNLVPGDTNNAADVFLATGSGASCPSGKPGLALSESRAYWASLADFSAGSLSVDYSVANTGGSPAYIIEIIGSTASNGVTSQAAMPLSLGNIINGDSRAFTIKYTVPAGVTSFRTSMTATAEDGCGATHNYP